MQCRWCAAPLESGASVCPTCKLYQSWFWNLLPYLGGFAAILVFASTAALNVWEQWNRIKSTNIGEVSLKVDSINSLGTIALFNDGERDVFVSSIVFSSPRMKDSRSINRLLHAGDFQTVEDKDSGAKKSDLRCIMGDPDLIKAICDGKEAVKNQTPVFYSEHHPELSAHFDLETTHPVVDATATIYYRSIGNDRTDTLVVPCKMVFMQCANLDGSYSNELIEHDETQWTRTTIKPELPMRERSFRVFHRANR